MNDDERLVSARRQQPDPATKVPRTDDGKVARIAMRADPAPALAPAVVLGAYDRIRGKRKSENPYSHDQYPFEHHAWRFGWAEAGRLKRRERSS